MPASNEVKQPVPKKARTKKLVDPAYQMRYALTLMVIATTEGVLLAGTLLVYIFSIIEISPEDHVRFFYALVFISLAGILVFNLVNMFIGFSLSHRISGPVYRFTQTLRKVAQGDFSQVVKLREKDEMQDLRAQINEMQAGLRNLVLRQRGQIDAALKTTQDLQQQTRGESRPDSAQAWDGLRRQLQELQTYFFL